MKVFELSNELNKCVKDGNGNEEAIIYLSDNLKVTDLLYALLLKSKKAPSQSALK